MGLPASKLGPHRGAGGQICLTFNQDRTFGSRQGVVVGASWLPARQELEVARRTAACEALAMHLQGLL